MAKLEAGSNFQLIMNQPGSGAVIFPTIATLPSSVVVTSTPTNVVMRWDDGWYEVISGSGLATNSDGVATGIVTGIQSYSSDPAAPGAVPDVTVTGLHFDVAAQSGEVNPFGAGGLSGDDQITGAGAADLIRGFTGADMLHGNGGNDVLFGNQGSDVLYGGQGADTLFGGQGADVVYGEAGNDMLVGNLGDDTLFGGQGSDIMAGNGGADVFVFGRGSGSDRDAVADFNAAEGDRIALADGVTYTVASDAAGNAVLMLSSGDTAILVGVSASVVNTDWFVVA